MRKTGAVFILIIFSSLLGSFLQSCCIPDPITFQLDAIYANPLRITGIEVSGNYDVGSFIVEPYQPDEKGIGYDSLGIEVRNELTYAYIPTNPVNSFGFSSAYACSPAVNFDILFDVVITSSEDYNSAYPKGTNLEEIMLAQYSYLVRGNNIDAFMVNKQLDESNIFYTFAYPHRWQGI